MRNVLIYLALGILASTVTGCWMSEKPVDEVDGKATSEKLKPVLPDGFASEFPSRENAKTSQSVPQPAIDDVPKTALVAPSFGPEQTPGPRPTLRPGIASPTDSLVGNQPDQAPERPDQPPERVVRSEDAKPIDPRVSYTGIFRNIDPAVQYVGDENCAQCHADLCTTFHQHPMGRSAIIAGSDTLEHYDAEAMNPFQVGPYELTVVKQEGGMLHRVAANLPNGEKVSAVDVPVTIAIGSGTRGRSYLNIDGDVVWQSPISWYSTNARWDVSPGFDLGYATQRPIVTECLYCHVNQHEAVDGSFNTYRDPINALQLAIGCERCHGPGELHARERMELSSTMAAGEIDTSIVNPAHLTESLQTAICAQCHLSGKERILRRGRSFDEFRPGLPIEQFITAFLAHPDAPVLNKAVSHFDQSALAKCRSAAGSPLMCTTCHDPHRVPEEQAMIGFYNRTCNNCHQTQTCSESEPVRFAKNDNCIGCHMPSDPSSNIPHTSLTDHRILRSPEKRESPIPYSRTEIPLIAFGDKTLVAPEELNRDLGIALSRFATRQPAESPLRSEAITLARTRLLSSLQRWPDDIPAWMSLGDIELKAGNLEQAVVASQGAIRAGKSREDVLSMVATVADTTGTFDLSLKALDRLLTIVPTSQDYLIKRMLGSVAAARWNDAERDCKALLEINPAHPSGHVVQGMILHGDGQKEEGRAEFEKGLLLTTTPQQRASFQTWFDRFVAYREQLE